MIDRKELRRQFVHIIIGALFVAFIYFEWVTAWVLFFILVVLGALSYFSTKYEIPLVSNWIEKYERHRDAQSFPGRGPILMVMGMLLSVELFSRDVALAAIAILVLGDSLSHIIGATFGKIKNPLSKIKLIEGTIAGTVAGTIGALAFVSFPEAFLGALAAMIIESLEIDMNKRPIDDNLIVPLVAGAVIMILRSL